MTPRDARTFYDDQIALLEAGDVERLIDEQYHEGALLLGYDVHVRGLADLTTHFHGYLAHLGGLKLISTDKFAEAEDSFMFEATVRTAAGIARVYDVFVLRDGKATHHYTGLLGFTPHEKEAGSP